MLLTRLVDYGRADPEVLPPFYQPARVRWVVELAPDGTPASPQLTDLAESRDRTRRYGVVHVVPAVQRSGTASKPMLAVDTAEYALGWASEPTRDAKATAYHAAFRELVGRWREAEPSVAAAALHAFLCGGHAAGLARPPDLAGSQRVAFRFQGRFVHDTEGARRFWAVEASERKGSARRGLCLACGRWERLLQTIPQQLPTRLVPGATNTASLVSFNKAAHGFALQTQLIHTPICTTCGLLATSALERLLDGTNSWALPGQDARLAWWVTSEVEFDLETLDDPQPEKVATMLGSAARGRRPADGWGPPVFCALVVGGNVSRVMVREWIEQPLPRIQDSLRKWFDDHEIVDAWTGEVRCVAMRRLTTTTGRWVRGRGEQPGHYAKLGAPGADRPGGVHRALLSTAVLAKPLPAKLLAHMVHRVRADGRLDTERAALIRLALRRRPGIPNPEAFMPMLNPAHRQPAYLAGRIFAALEDVQASASRARGDQQLNTTFTDRYFARAITSPAVAIVAGRRDAGAWLKRLRRDRPAWAAAAERRLDELFEQLAEAGGPPHGALLADQAAFILGYHQQRAAIRAERVSRTATKLEGAPA
jgi:CRISPR-associated protein Csd1